MNASLIAQSEFAAFFMKLQKLFDVPEPSERYTTVIALSGKLTATTPYLPTTFPSTFTE
ncbi:unannotated protein [freshwater metagenome]|uniref:Unannotated protein n=1 Tax=freshwater metagenome TaxID=449393 RepID=A0A6J6UGR0_9ZZZZ